MAHPDVIMYPSPIASSKKSSTSAKGKKTVSIIKKIRIITRFKNPRKKKKILWRKNSVMKMIASPPPTTISPKTIPLCPTIHLKLKNFLKWIPLLNSAKSKTNKI